MNRLKISAQVLLIGSMFLGLTFTAPESASATSQWFWSHGHTAKVQYPENTVGMAYFGWGLDLTEKPSTANWVHIAVPTPSTYGISMMRARYIKIRFFTGSADVWISNVDVWNGDIKIKEFSSLDWNGDWQTRQLDLGTLVNFDLGVGLSVKVVAGVEPMSHRFIIAGAGARFE